MLKVIAKYCSGLATLKLMMDVKNSHEYELKSLVSKRTACVTFSLRFYK